MPCLSQEKGRGTMGRITSFEGMTLDRFPSPLPPPPGFLWSQMWLMMHLCWNDHCCDELRKWVLWRHRPSSCLEGWPGEGQRAGETREFGRMHRKPQSLTDSTSCCCSAQPLRSSVMSLLMKERSKVLLSTPRNLTWCCTGWQCRQQAGALWLKCQLLAGNIVSLPRRKHLDVRGEKRVTFYFLSSRDKCILYMLSGILAEGRPTVHVLCTSLVQLISTDYFRAVYDSSFL